jgi:hypothetical protein
LIRLRWPAVACPIRCLVCADQAATFVITQEYGDPDRDWRLRWILQSSEEPTDVVGVQGGRLHRREVPATVEVGPVSAGQQMDVHDMVDEIGCLISRSLCWGTVTPGVPVGQAAEFWNSSRAADELRPAQPCFGNGREGTRLPTNRMRQLDPGRSVVRVSASGLGSNE